MIRGCAVILDDPHSRMSGANMTAENGTAADRGFIVRLLDHCVSPKQSLSIRVRYKTKRLEILRRRCWNGLNPSAC